MLNILGLGEDMAVATYIRCSSDKQNTAHQKLAIRGWLKKNDLTDLELLEYEDHAFSGASSNRPGFQQLKAAIAKGQIERIVMFEVSRASRDMLDYLEFVGLARKHSCKIDIVGKGIIGVESSTDVLLAAVNAYAAQNERENISARIRSGMANAKSKGVKIGAQPGQKRKLGKTKVYAPELIQEIKSMSSKKLSNYDIARFLKPRYAVSEPTVRRIKKSEQYQGKT